MEYQRLIQAGVHYGHSTRKWHPNMAPYIFTQKKGLHVIDIKKTQAHLSTACEEIYRLAFAGNKILFVGTKLQAKTLVEEYAQKVHMPYVSERWLGGMFTNFATIRRSLRRIQSMEKMMQGDTFKSLNKKERLMMERSRQKRLKLLGGISEMNKLPASIFVVDINQEKIAVEEARKLSIPVMAMVDTNVNPKHIDFPIPSNDDGYKSIECILQEVTQTIERALQDRKKGNEKAKETQGTQQGTQTQGAQGTQNTQETAPTPTPPVEGKTDDRKVERARINSTRVKD